MNETDLVVQDLLEKPSDDTYTSKRVTMISMSLEVKKELRVLIIQTKRFSKDQCRAILRLCSYFILVYMYTVNASPTTHWYL